MNTTKAIVFFVTLLVSIFGLGGAAETAGPAKYAILLIGDGMGWWHVDAAHKYLDKGDLAMETLQYKGYMTTFMRNPASVDPDLHPREYWDNPSEIGSYDAALGGTTPWQFQPVPTYVDSGTTDSAASGSAMANGHKTPKYSLNVLPKDEGYDGNDPSAVQYFSTITDSARAAGKATGTVTSVNFYHATPAAFAAKTQYRKNYGEIIRQMIYSDMEVVMGAGHPAFNNDGEAVTPDWGKWGENRGNYLEDEDGEALYDLVAAGFQGRVFIQTKGDFEDLSDGGTFRGGPVPTRVFGLAQVAETLQFNRTASAQPSDASPEADTNGIPSLDGPLIQNVPSLQTMAEGALTVLEQDPEGFFLMIEGGAIDWAGHASNLRRVVEEAADFDNTVHAVIEWVNDPGNGSSWDNTIVVVTADHETGHLQPVGDAVGGAVFNNECWGPGCVKTGSHTNSLVPIYAQGPGASRFQARFPGDHRDNTDIFKIIYQSLFNEKPKPVHVPSTLPMILSSGTFCGTMLPLNPTWSPSDGNGRPETADIRPFS